MFCKHCGEKIEEGAINCTKCGKPTKKIDINKFNKILDFVKSKKIPLACVGIILIIGIIIVSATTKYTTINMKDLYTIQFTGLNENGKATVIFNDSALYEPTQKLFEKGDYLGQSALAELSELEYTISPNENLSNGDEITFKVYFPEEYYKNYNIKAKNTEQKIKVADLIIPEEIDVFEGLKIEFSGRSPYLTCNFVTGDCHKFTKDYVRFETDNEYYAIGEKVNVTARFSTEDLEKAKVKVINDKATFDVQAKEYYIDSLDGLDLTQLKNAIRTQLDLEYNSATNKFCGVNLGGGTAQFIKLLDEKATGDAFLVLRDKDSRPDGEYTPYNIYISSYKTTIEAKKYSIATKTTKQEINVLLLATNLYIDENNQLHYDEIIEVRGANVESTKDLKSKYIKDCQDIYQTISSVE